MEQEKFIKGLAFEYGVKAFKKGWVCAPAIDREFMDRFIKGRQVGDKIGMKYMKEWAAGWTSENLKD